MVGGRETLRLLVFDSFVEWSHRKAGPRLLHFLGDLIKHSGSIGAVQDVGPIPCAEAVSSSIHRILAVDFIQPYPGVFALLVVIIRGWPVCIIEETLCFVKLLLLALISVDAVCVGSWNRSGIAHLLGVAETVLGVGVPAEVGIRPVVDGTDIIALVAGRVDLL